MAGDWIKLEHTTPDKPEIDQLATALGIDQDCAFGKCVRLWIWADQQSVNGDGLSVTNAFVDRLVFCNGFAKALCKVGWLSGRDGRLSIPNFCQHNGETAKTRALSARRNAAKRKRDARSVTSASPREEREREKRNTHPPSQASQLKAEGFEADWERWCLFRESIDGRPPDPISAEANLMELSRRGPEKAKRDIDFSIRKSARSILDSDNDFEKRPSTPRNVQNTKELKI